MLAVGQAQKADLVALEELLHHNLLLMRAQQGAGKQAVRGFECRGAALADDHALARGQAVGLHHDRRMEALNGAFQFRAVGAQRVMRGGNIVPLQKSLGEPLARFQLGSFPAGTEGRKSAPAQRIDNAQR